MGVRPRLIVTGYRSDGRSAIARDQTPEPVTVGAAPGAEFYLLWGTEDGGASVGGKTREPKLLPFFAGPGGTRLLLARYAPRSAIPESAGDPAELSDEAARLLPGLMDPFEPGDSSGMHATDTLDYAICLEGELWLELDGGEEARLTPGTCVVQSGTRHAWHNRSDETALMCFVGIGATREPR